MNNQGNPFCITYRNGYSIKVATICGGLAKSDLFIQTNADVLQIEVMKPDQAESVLLGAAMLGASAALSRDATHFKNRFLNQYIV